MVAVNKNTTPGIASHQKAPDVSCRTTPAINKATPDIVLISLSVDPKFFI